MKWLHVGTSPHVLQDLGPLKAQIWDGICTANSGIGIVPYPTHWVGIDRKAQVKFEAQCRVAQMRAGTTCLTWGSGRDHGHWCDLFVEQMGHPWLMTGLSGIVALEYAILCGAAEIVLVGCDGYLGTSCHSTVNYWDGYRGQACGETINRRLVDALRRLCRQYARVQFTITGNPIYTIDTPNWRHLQ